MHNNLIFQGNELQRSYIFMSKKHGLFATLLEISHTNSLRVNVELSTGVCAKALHISLHLLVNAITVINLALGQ